MSNIQPTFYYPIEISPAALAACEKELGQIDMVSIVGYEQPYLDGLRSVAGRLRKEDHLLVLFLGSTIGNFDREAAEEFLRDVRRILRFGDALLLGTDLEKSAETQLLAYDDPTGVTAAFNLNLLARPARDWPYRLPVTGCRSRSRTPPAGRPRRNPGRRRSSPARRRHPAGRPMSGRRRSARPGCSGTPACRYRPG